MATAHPARRNEAISSLVITVFVQGTEDESKVLTASHLIVPEHVHFYRRHVTGHFGNPIVVLKAYIKAPEAIYQICESIRQKLPKNSLKFLQSQIRQHLGEKHTVIIKFDKQAAARGIVEFGKNDPIVIRVKLSSYPVVK